MRGRWRRATVDAPALIVASGTTSMASDVATTDYYARRAEAYERIYAKPERQVDLERLREVLADYFDGRHVLELAFGTGYWTVPVAARCGRVVGVDINQEVLDIALAKTYARHNVEFMCADLYGDQPFGGPFDACLAAFWWSHVAMAELPTFVDAICRRLAPGAQVMILDNAYVLGSSTPISRTDYAGNTYQLRLLDDGSEFEVMKNFLDAEAAMNAVSHCATNVRFTTTDYYWYMTFDVCAPINRSS
jgi:SAM-dependent methyltransferase